MKLFDPHIHMTSRTTDDYEAMAKAGIAAIVEPAFWVGQPRTHVGTFEDYFLSLLGWERFRAGQFGIHHFCTLAVNPKEANDPAVVDGVLALLPGYLEKDGVVAVGEIGYDDMTPAEDRMFAAQLELAQRHGLPALIHLPHRDKKRGCERTLALCKEVGFAPEKHPRRSQHRGDPAADARRRVLGRPLDLSADQDGRAAHGRAGQAVRPEPSSW